MTAYIGCAGLLGIVVFIALLSVRRKKIENEMTDFYKENSLYATTDAPPSVRESLGASDNLYSCKASLLTTAGERIEFYWWEWNVKSTTTVNGVPTASYDYYLAVSFAPNAVSGEFAERAMRLADKSGDDFSQKAKDFFVLNTGAPYRAERLADGNLVICWRVLKRRDVYDAKIAWLKNNVVPQTPIETPKKTAETSETVFYTHETYATLCQKFIAAWTNLELEMNHWSAVFQHEGRDEFDGGAAFGDPNRPNEAAFVLNDETTVGEARRKFSETYGAAVYILRGGRAVEDDQTLAAGNNV